MPLKINNNLFSKFFFLAIITLPFGVIYKPEFLGYLGASPAIPVFMLLGAFGLIGARKFDALSRSARQLYVYGVLCSLISLAVFGWTELSAIKAVSYLCLCLAWISPLLCLERVLLSSLRRALFLGLLISIMAFLIGDLNGEILPFSLKQFIFSGDYINYADGRPRGFQAEPSHFSATLGRYLFCFFLVLEVGRAYSRKRLLFFLLLATLCMILTGSKGATITLGIVVLFIMLSKSLFRYFLLLIPILCFIVVEQFTVIIYDIENFTSVSTRFGMLITAIYAIAFNPFGYGYYGFYDAISYFGNIVLHYLANFDLNMREFQWIVEELKTVSFKSTLLDFLVIYGMGFLLFLYQVFRVINFHDPRARAGFIYFIISALSVEGHNSVMFFLGLSILYVYYKKSAVIV